MIQLQLQSNGLFLKILEGFSIHSCWILNSTQWIRDSRYCIPAFVNSES